MKTRNRNLLASLILFAVTSQTTPLLAMGISKEKKPTATTDWSKAMVESTLKRFPTAQDLGSWGYAKSLYLYGSYLVWRRDR